MNNFTSIMWFRQDLRIRDNAALDAAIARGGAVVPVYVWTPEEEWDWRPGAAARWWLRHSLLELSSSLKSLGSKLIVRRGDPARILNDVVNETGATAVFFNRRFEPTASRGDRRVMSSLATRGIDVHPFNDSLLFDPAEVRNRAGAPFRVFTPFWKHLLTLDDPGRRSPAHGWIPGPAVWPRSARITDKRILATDGASNALHEVWAPGELGAQKAMHEFTGGATESYARHRDHPGENGTSRLSPHLRHGELSPRRVWYEVSRARGSSTGLESDPFLRQLAWREFGYHLLHHFPDSPVAPMRESFRAFPWKEDEEALRLWRAGRTGYPIVDAGMRELMTTGWMHNRVRMVAASFLVKHLMVHWLEGARWFWERLVDADLASNTMGWQWVAGCGADAAPYFRVFNPVAQGRKFDAHGEYVRRWIPELAGLPDEYLHAPWTAPLSVLKEARVDIGRNYPAPVVDHAFARERALDAYESIRRNGLSMAGATEEAA